MEEIKDRFKSIENILSGINKRLNVLEDTEQIKQLQYQYLNCVMFTRWDDIMDCFADNSTVDFVEGNQPIVGKPEIEKNFRERIAKVHVGKEGDFTIHPIITVDGDKAKGNWVMYIMYFYPATGQSLFWVQGIYDADYVRENGKWKFSYLKWRERLGKPGGGPPMEPFK